MFEVYDTKATLEIELYVRRSFSWESRRWEPTEGLSSGLHTQHRLMTAGVRGPLGNYPPVPQKMQFVQENGAAEVYRNRKACGMLHCSRLTI